MENILNVKIEKLNYNYFDEEDDIIVKKNLKSKYVSDGINEDYKQWTSQTPVFISAQTGNGKNHFIENKLIPYCQENNHNILLISNRIANNRQAKLRIAKITNCEDIITNHTESGLDLEFNFGNVTILSYQKLKSYFNELPQHYNKYSYVIFDECHFFISDSLFNSYTYNILSNCVKHFTNSKRIYMSATPDEILPTILKLEKEQQNSSPIIVKAMYSIQNSFRFIYYKFERDYNYINPILLNESKNVVDDIVKCVFNSTPDEKWVIFVSNKDLGEKLKDNLNSKFKENSTKDNIENKKTNEAIFISAASRYSEEADNAAYNELIKNNKFEYRVLISTSIFDNGVNFVDKDLKNILIMHYDKTEFLQMLGRKRISNNDSINLYLWNPGINKFLGKLKRINSQLQMLDLFNSNYNAFINKYINSNINQLPSYVFYINDKKYNNGSFNYNMLAEKKLLIDKNFYTKIIEKLKNDKNAYLKEQLSWLNLELAISNSSNLANNKLEEFLEESYNKQMSKEDFKVFCELYKSAYIECYGKRKEDNASRPAYGPKIIKDTLKNLKLPYELKNDKGIYTITKISQLYT